MQFLSRVPTGNAKCDTGQHATLKGTKQEAEECHDLPAVGEGHTSQHRTPCEHEKREPEMWGNAGQDEVGRNVGEEIGREKEHQNDRVASPVAEI